MDELYRGRNAVEYLTDFIVKELYLTDEDWENLNKLGYYKKVQYDISFEYKRAK